MHCNRACSEFIVIRTIATHPSPYVEEPPQNLSPSPPFSACMTVLLVFLEAREAQFNTGSEFCFPFKYPTEQNPPLQGGKIT